MAPVYTMVGAQPNPATTAASSQAGLSHQHQQSVGFGGELGTDAQFTTGVNPTIYSTASNI